MQWTKFGNFKYLSGVAQRSYGMLNGVRGIFHVEADWTGAEMIEHV